MLVSREHHLADAFTFTLLRRGPARRSWPGRSARRRRRRRLAGHLREALEPDGTLVATSSSRTRSAIPRRLGGAGPGEWTAALVQTLAEVRAATAGREIVALSFGSQLDGVVAAAADGEPLRPALIWCDRRAGEVRRRRSGSIPERLRELTGCNLDPGHVAEDRLARPARARDPRGRGGVRLARLVGRLAGVRRAGRRSLERVLDRRARSRGARVVGRGVRGVRRRPGAAAPGARADAVLGPIRDWLCEATGLDAGRWWSSAPATRWRRRSAPASSSRAWCATCWAPPSRSARSSASRPTTRPASSSCIPTPTRTRGCWRTPAGCRAAPTAGSATSSAGWRRCAPPERRRRLRAAGRARRPRRRARTACCGCPRSRARWRRSGTPTRAPAGSA